MKERTSNLEARLIALAVRVMPSSVRLCTIVVGRALRARPARATERASHLHGIVQLHAATGITGAAESLRSPPSLLTVGAPVPWVR